MKFPRVKDSWEWCLVETEDFKLELDDGTERVVGVKKVYQKINNPLERALEIYVFGNQLLARMWVGNVKEFKPVYAQIKKAGQWLGGMENESIAFQGLSLDGKFCGVSVELRVAPDRVEQVRVFNFAIGMNLKGTS
ncbi:MAG: hypothetical protein HZB99_02270 [Candidatus Harrisonbacteria bacterium]|nr:hypothetical protein [Candidatus Harrisonbacteria bacterium]